jgi:hypothetical protein
MSIATDSDAADLDSAGDEVARGAHTGAMSHALPGQ